MNLDLPESFNAAEVMVDRNIQEGRGEKVAFRTRERDWAYGEVLSGVNKTGNALKSLGMGPEERVVLLLLDGVEFAMCFFGAIKMGAIPIPTNTLLRPHELFQILEDSRARAVIANSTLMPGIEEIKDNLPHLEHLITVGEAQGEEFSFWELIEGESQELSAFPSHRDEPAFWLYSSGSTGMPKGAVHLHHDMVYCCETYAKGVLGINENDTAYSIAKLFFAYGLGNSLYFPFYVGGAAVLNPGRPDPEDSFRIIETFRPTLFYAVPTFYAAMLQVPDAEKRFDTSSLRLCISAGEVLPPELLSRWRERFGVEILDGIGTTEILHIFISNRPGDIKPGSTGKPVPGYEIRIVDEKGEDLPPGEVGNVLVKGESLSPYYWNRHEATKQTMLGEWMFTGDKYYRDEEGYLFCCGRGDDMLKVGGIWVSPAEVEMTLVAHPAVLEAAVVGAPDKENLIKPKAFVVLKAGFEPSDVLAEELKSFVKEKIAPYKFPRWIEFVPDLPKTATGKIQRFRLREGETS